jgi:hypothetical protein
MTTLTFLLLGSAALSAATLLAGAWVRRRRAWWVGVPYVPIALCGAAVADRTWLRVSWLVLAGIAAAAVAAAATGRLGLRRPTEGPLP